LTGLFGVIFVDFGPQTTLIFTLPVAEGPAIVDPRMLKDIRAFLLVLIWIFLQSLNDLHDEIEVPLGG